MENLLEGLDQNSLCEVIAQFGNPIQHKDLQVLLNLSTNLRKGIALCVTQIDFTNGIALIDDYRLLNPVSHTPFVNQAYLERFPRLQEYRIVHTVGDLSESTNFTDYLINDVRARYLRLDKYGPIEASWLDQLAQAFAVRFAKYGANFTLVMVHGKDFTFGYSNGNLIVSWKYTNIAHQIGNFLLEQIPSQYLTGFSQPKYVFNPIYEQIKAGQSSIQRVIVNDGSEFGDYDGYHYIYDLLPYLTEVLFRPWALNPIPSGTIYSDPNNGGKFDLYLYLMIRDDRITTIGYLEVLFTDLLFEDRSFPNLTKFEIPVPQATLRELKTVFPNVTHFGGGCVNTSSSGTCSSGFNILEDYIEAYLRDVFKHSDPYGIFEMSSVYRKIQRIRTFNGRDDVDESLIPMLQMDYNNDNMYSDED